jgi:lipoprotein-releasing system ATP-binding protein
VQTEVLHGIDLTLRRGEFSALIGPSGSGKSTLLNQIGLLDRPTQGSVQLLGQATEGLNDNELTALRSRRLGFVFQFHHLVSALTVAQNLTIPLSIPGRRLRGSFLDRALLALDEVGLKDRAHARPDELSGGQQQRVAIARALIHQPDLVLADEPTGNLDTESADVIFKLLRRFSRERGMTFLIVTHDPRLAERCDRIITIVDGAIESDIDKGNSQSDPDIQPSSS